MYKYAPDLEQKEIDNIMQDLVYDLSNGRTFPKSESINSLNEEIYGSFEEDNDTG